MSGVRLEVQWSPVHPDKFITWGTEIFLYEVASLKDATKLACSKVSDTTAANLLATNSNHHYVKCVDIYPQPEPDILLAIGQANGKVVLTTFGPTAFDALGLTGKELVPRHARQCNTVAWNPVDSNLIAAGLDKYKADHSVLLWDVLKCPHHGDGRTGMPSVSYQHHAASQALELARPVAELGLSETAHSLAWFNTQSRSLIIGMNNKHLKLVDLRDSNKAVNSTPTKAVYGLVVDPHNDHQLASFVENQISVWDTRNFEKPVLTLIHSKPVIKVLWCPTRHNLLGSLLRDSTSLHLHDIQYTVVGNDEVEPFVQEQSVHPGTANNITSFSWHPTHENRLLTIALSGTITDYVVFERITINCSPNTEIVWTHGRWILKLINDKVAVFNSLDDILVIFKRRALNDYGLKPELWQNGDLAEEESLKNLWHWLYLSRSLVEDGSMRGVDSKLPGIRCVLKIDSNETDGSEMISKPWVDLGKSINTVRIYRSENREKAMQLCGWKFDKESSLTSFLDRLESEGLYTRAAAIAVFNMKLRKAIDILNRAALSQNKQQLPSNLNIVAMALSGFSDDRSSMWRELCLASRSRLSEPYLRATFAFLTAEADNYENVLNESGVAVEDRVAFACTFLSDVKLNEYLKQLTAKLTEEGDLAGILLTGTSSDGVQLLQRYLDVTRDVQSVSLLAVRVFPRELLLDSRVQNWIDSYRVLLDAWRLWNQRAHFDILLNACSPNDKAPQQIFVSCNFCGKSISAQMQGIIRNRGAYARLGATSQKLKMSSCPQCRKPLPRCAICLVHMGTPSGLQNNNSMNSNGRSSTANNKMAEFSSWFTFCQSCRHGGHAAHMTHWFREHSECPVTFCTCRCSSLDTAREAASIITHIARVQQ
ncbi:GATOR complex protein MIOS [Zootermopsis nevadensis]|uniref:WD repeat-containing protein mio n=1 Tax=Zootermopsis nevadensis TaxID=136037 RepID=A0A067R031_ZOONE|nr:GATOR complex protein MIOS [Zootermopsis nevadensis]XP_021925948.1 GATOR complex protein MIOS [Zootermopsis nevadensis]XP_021925949.1 GATOR complex protein MIOS [Zootermopsis nevadensis]KDR16180.1 WD repeat-containing protein mio [Zootermopsis nevadensis]